ncbi:hypothetical protein EUX98_g5328 [Antrodiella citrinella]|uniref:Aminoglycoside phosphotransferase domain-containing protein n=1 Tax=Antrodiella citrinella TaxID=2447956 RepID=A0A4S4MRP5_9APHY|nr:hypothetical protein EUX98_g5328 [Antrodiella citrinella]
MHDRILVERQRKLTTADMLSQAIWYLPRMLWLSLPSSWRAQVYKYLIMFARKHYPLNRATFTTRLPFQMYSKLCYDPVERDALAFIWRHTTIPIPRIIDFVKDPSSDPKCPEYYLITSRVEGKLLGQWLWEKPHDITLVVRDLKDALTQLRSIPPSSNAVSSLYGGEFYCPRLMARDPIGPFADIKTFHEFLFSVVHFHADHNALRTLAQKSHSKTHRLCYTHGDLNYTNILVKEDGSISGIIDWQAAGWLPEYWDHCAALWHGRKLFQMKEVIKAAFPPYDEELEVEQALWKESDHPFGAPLFHPDSIDHLTDLLSQRYIFKAAPMTSVQWFNPEELEENGIYATLFTNNPGISWHWILYFHREHRGKSGKVSPGYKLHATDKYGAWRYECASQDLLASATLVIVGKIGAVVDNTWGVEFLDEYLKNIRMEVPQVDRGSEPRFTCRVWFREAIRTFNAAQLFVRCPDVDALELELSNRARLVEYRSSIVAFQPTADVPLTRLIAVKNARPWSGTPE